MALNRQGAGFHETTAHKLQHDFEQFRWLVTTDKLNHNDNGKSCLEGELALPHIYESVLDRMTQTDDDDQTSFYCFTQADADNVLA